jgi:hypothetical protein
LIALKKVGAFGFAMISDVLVDTFVFLGYWARGTNRIELRFGKMASTWGVLLELKHWG